VKFRSHNLVQGQNTAPPFAIKHHNMINEFSRQLDFFQDLFESFTEDDFLDVISLGSGIDEPVASTMWDAPCGNGAIDKTQGRFDFPVSVIHIDESSSCAHHFRDSCFDHAPAACLPASRAVSPGSTSAVAANENCTRSANTQSYTDRSYIPASAVAGADSLCEAIYSLKSGHYDKLTALNPNPNNRNKQLIQFPVRLYAMLDRMDRDGFGHIISWQPHGRCFVIHEPSKFQDLLPGYLPGINKLTSFQRQLNIYGFRRLTHGEDKNGYFQEFFLRDRPHLLPRVNRIAFKGGRPRVRSTPEDEPNFYEMPFVAALAESTTVRRIVSSSCVLRNA
jgi:HSF-type DNA-binding